jgi:hypothetical protein
MLQDRNSGVKSGELDKEDYLGICIQRKYVGFAIVMQLVFVI